MSDLLSNLQRAAHPHSIADLKASAVREVKKRIEVYPGEIYKQRMKKSFADLEVSKMDAITRVLEVIADADPSGAGRLI
jgi:hypothetical protein